MFGWLFHPGRTIKRKLKKEAQGWNHTNFFNAAKPARRPRRRSMAEAWAGMPVKRSSTLQKAYRQIRELKNEIKQKNNQIMQLKRINKAQQPMTNSGVNAGTYELYRSGFTRIMAITMKRQRLSTYTMPEIRSVCDEMLGRSKPTEFKGYPKR